MTTDRWVEVGDGVLVRRHAELDLSTGLVVGERSALVVDTRGDPEQGSALAEAVREVTALPWAVVLTHAHFDHCLGTAAFLPTPVWAHPACRDDLARGGAAQHAEAVAHGSTRPVPVRPVVPDRVVADRAELDLGRRRVLLLHPGAGHTDADLVVVAGDVLFAGDLVEQGAPPAFDDAFPLQWPATVTALLALGATTVVPGHGEPVDTAFVEAQRDALAALAALCRDCDSAAEVVARSPFDEVTTLTALARATRRAAGSVLPTRQRGRL